MMWKCKTKCKIYENEHAVKYNDNGYIAHPHVLSLTDFF